MSHSKPVPLTLSGVPRVRCPVCGSVVYSQSGIHPQCAMQQADSPRMDRIRRAKQAAEGNKRR